VNPPRQLFSLSKAQAGENGKGIVFSGLEETARFKSVLNKRDSSLTTTFFLKRVVRDRSLPPIPRACQACSSRRRVMLLPWDGFVWKLIGGCGLRLILLVESLLAFFILGALL
jgi:hypothetical protein